MTGILSGGEGDSETEAGVIIAQVLVQAKDSPTDPNREVLPPTNNEKDFTIGAPAC
jgi:hypothetical protein